ncbi:protein EI24 [Cinnamomum micranthum f. kanehirae]|uniref:Protein EI24 n=1 Tax=Cinnamomum micranthum f. kanehirae TaxID=337451 RepID=A0A443Q2E4_9MAGN|nr:protein EI24 [Cinnamomum micranthum f. kanehirae]
MTVVEPIALMNIPAASCGRAPLRCPAGAQASARPRCCCLHGAGAPRRRWPARPPPAGSAAPALPTPIGARFAAAPAHPPLPPPRRRPPLLPPGRPSENNNSSSESHLPPFQFTMQEASKIKNPISMELPLRDYVKPVVLSWLAGFREACCFHRVLFFCTNSRKLSIRTGECFLLNGLIFLGSILILNSMVIPILLWILPDQCQQFGPQNLCGSPDIVELYTSIRYNEIAKLAFSAMGRYGPAVVESSSQNELSDTQNVANKDKPAGFGGVITGIAEQAYSVLLLSFFFLEVYATGFIPYIGKAINFLLLSWMYAYYCFEYKWNLSELSLDRRLDFFESNWAFFAGFGSPCVLAIFFFPPLVSYGVMALLFPLFVLTATGTQEVQVIDYQRRSWRIRRLRKLPIFYVADKLALKLLDFFDKDDKGWRQD